DRQAHSAHHRRRPTGRARLPVPRPPSHGALALDRFEMGDGQGPQSRVQVLPPDAGWPQAACAPGIELEANRHRGRQRHQAWPGRTLMSLWRDLLSRVSGFWLGRDRIKDFRREIESHLDLEAEEQQDSGLSARESRYRARRAFGNIALVEED